MASDAPDTFSFFDPAKPSHRSMSEPPERVVKLPSMHPQCSLQPLASRRNLDKVLKIETSTNHYRSLPLLSSTAEASNDEQVATTSSKCPHNVSLPSILDIVSNASLSPTKATVRQCPAPPNTTSVLSVERLLNSTIERTDKPRTPRLASPPHICEQIVPIKRKGTHPDPFSDDRSAKRVVRSKVSSSALAQDATVALKSQLQSPTSHSALEADPWMFAPGEVIQIETDHNDHVDTNPKKDDDSSQRHVQQHLDNDNADHISLSERSCTVLNEPHHYSIENARKVSRPLVLTWTDPGFLDRQRDTIMELSFQLQTTWYSVLFLNSLQKLQDLDSFNVHLKHMLRQAKKEDRVDLYQAEKLLHWWRKLEKGQVEENLSREDSRTIVSRFSRVLMRFRSEVFILDRLTINAKMRRV